MTDILVKGHIIYYSSYRKFPNRQIQRLRVLSVVARGWREEGNGDSILNGW